MIIRIVLLLTTLCLGALSLGGCNTVQGAGRDIETAGSKIQQEAQEHKRY